MGRPKKTEFVVGQSPYRSAFSFEVLGIKPDPTKAYRFVDPKRIEERKNAHGYVFTKVRDGDTARVSEDGTIRTKGNMVLMERSRDREDERRREKEAFNRWKEGQVRDTFNQEIEKASIAHGKNLHKYTQDRD